MLNLVLGVGVFSLLPTGVFMRKNPRLSRPEARLEGRESFRRVYSLVRFVALIRFARPHSMAQ